MASGIDMRFENDDIVYWHRQRGYEHFAEVGRVDEHFSDAVIIDLLEPKETRFVDGVPLDDVPFVGEWHKLPKGWTYNTVLFNLEWRNDELKQYPYNIRDKKGIRELYERGLLVRSCEKFQGEINTEITKEGWRLVKHYPMGQSKVTHVSVAPFKVYSTYEEAEKEVNDYLAELQRQASLSDYEWSVELIQNTLNRWQKIYGIPDDVKQKHFDWIISLKNVEDISVRISGGNIQWKYEKNKRWNDVDLVF